MERRLENSIAIAHFRLELRILTRFPQLVDASRIEDRRAVFLYDRVRICPWIITLHLIAEIFAY